MAEVTGENVLAGDEALSPYQKLEDTSLTREIGTLMDLPPQDNPVMTFAVSLDGEAAQPLSYYANQVRTSACPRGGWFKILEMQHALDSFRSIPAAI